MKGARNGEPRRARFAHSASKRRTRTSASRDAEAFRKMNASPRFSASGAVFEACSVRPRRACLGFPRLADGSGRAGECTVQRSEWVFVLHPDRSHRSRRAVTIAKRPSLGRDECRNDEIIPRIFELLCI